MMKVNFQDFLLFPCLWSSLSFEFFFFFFFYPNLTGVIDEDYLSSCWDFWPWKLNLLTLKTIPVPAYHLFTLSRLLNFTLQFVEVLNLNLWTNKLHDLDKLSQSNPFYEICQSESISETHTYMQKDEIYVRLFYFFIFLFVCFYCLWDLYSFSVVMFIKNVFCS